MRLRAQLLNLGGMAAGLIALGALVPAAMSAQDQGEAVADPSSRVGDARWELGAAFTVMSPRGHFGTLVGERFGAGLSATLGFDDVPVFRVRFDAGYVNYGSETVEFPLFSATDRVLDSIVTLNHILYSGLGPEVRLPYGPVQPYVNGFVGIGYFFTASASDHEMTVNLGDLRPAYGFGGGLSIRLNRSGRPLRLKLDAQYRQHGQTKYLIPGSIVEDGSGGTSVTAISSDVDFLLFQVGLTVGL
ncbi:hypothetical protein [Candidatus Palauibacter sp.]|uniref:hypothetical protein n=1 Tax=Candidatus Palauibacter sp. TaxID=3101350 RepID=UPI003B5CE445